MARPRIELDVLPDDWEEQMFSWYRQGYSEIEVRCKLGEIRSDAPGRPVSDDLWYRWIEESPSFSRAVKDGRRLSEAWWLARGRQGLDQDGQGAGSFPYVGWYMNMKNRFGWRDRQDVTSDDKPIQVVRRPWGSLPAKGQVLEGEATEVPEVPELAEPE